MVEYYMEHFKVTSLHLNRDLPHELKKLDDILGRMGGKRVLGEHPNVEFADEDYKTRMVSYAVGEVMILAYAAQNPQYASLDIKGDVQIDLYSASRPELEGIVEKLKEKYPVLREKKIESITLPND